MDIIHNNIRISGKVQGVGFRYACLTAARRYGIKGYVKNLSDGDVYIEAEGQENGLTLFLKWCNEGPAHARVTSVQVIRESIQGFTYFDIKR